MSGHYRHVRGLAGACLLIAALAGAAEPSPLPPGDDPAIWRQALLATVVRQRAALGEAPVTASERLDRAAQQHVEEMVAGGWFGFTSPTGLSIEERVEAEGYRPELVAAKIYREPAVETAAALAERWWNEAGRSRQSLFHGGVREVGMGIAVDGDQRLFVFVLATAPAPDALPPSLGDAATRRAAFLAAVNELRASHGLSALYSDAALDRAAEDHAAALLAALRAGRPLSTVAVLASRLGGDLAASQPVIHDVRSSGVHRQRGMFGHQKLDKAVGAAVVVDAMSAAEALATAAVAAEGGDLLTPGYRKLGLGVALDMTGEKPHVVWVACLTGR